ncbi:MAG: hypothetical protein QOH42_2436 [Blastocatellia bacterium]|nr:hypothetical protein [Blastocatellia bacterium]
MKKRLGILISTLVISVVVGVFALPAGTTQDLSRNRSDRSFQTPTPMPTPTPSPSPSPATSPWATPTPVPEPEPAPSGTPTPTAPVTHKLE